MVLQEYSSLCSILKYVNSELRIKAVRLRLDMHMSYSAIQKELDVPKSTLSGWLREYPLSEERILELRRQGWRSGEASRERFRNTMRKKREASFQEFYKAEILRLQKHGSDSRYTAGLALYAAEGAKKDLYRISLANTDSKIILFFIRWLGEFLDIHKEELKFQLHLYKNMDIEKETRFWKDSLKIKHDQLYKTQVRDLTKSSFVYRESFRHGTCSMYFSNRDKKARLMAGIKAFFDLHQD